MALSFEAKTLMHLGKCCSVNEGLKIIYGQQGHNELKRYDEWTAEGKQVRRGEKALLLWGSKRQANKQEVTAEDTTENDKYKFFPICYVFSNLQVTDKETA